MGSNSDNHNLYRPSKDETGWGGKVSNNFSTIEKRLVIRDTEANRTNYTPHEDATFVATDTGAVYDGDGVNWNAASRDFESVGLEKASIEVDNDVTHLDQNDPDKPDVDSYLNTTITKGETVVIDPGTHTVPAITLTAGCHIIWRGTLVPDADHNVITFDNGAEYVEIEPEGTTHIDTTGLGTYTSDAVVSHGRVRTYGIFGVSHSGRIGWYHHQSSSGDNLNHTRMKLRLNGADAGEYGLVVDNTSGAAINLNDMRVKIVETRSHTAYGAYLNAGAVNTYHISGDSNNICTGWYSGDDASPPAFIASGTTHRGIEAWVRADSNNTNNDEVSSGVTRSRFAGSFKGTPIGLAEDTIYQQGSILSARDTGKGVAAIFENNFANDNSEGVIARWRGASATTLFDIEARGNGIVKLAPGDSVRQTDPFGFPAEDLSLRDGTFGGETAVDDGTNTTSGNNEVAVWDASLNGGAGGWHTMGGDVI